MNIRPYLTYQGTCNEAIALYERAFHTKAQQIMHFADIPQSPQTPVPEGFKNQIVQATLQIGGGFIRLSDCPTTLNAPESERFALAVEASAKEVTHAFAVLAEEGRIAIPLAETFYSPCAGVVFDKFGVMWNFIAQK